MASFVKNTKESDACSCLKYLQLMLKFRCDTGMVLNNDVSYAPVVNEQLSDY